MNIALIGGTGRTNRLVLDVLTDRGHRVTVLVRDPGRLGRAADDADARVIRGDVRDVEALRRLVDGCDVVISALGPTDKEADLHTDAARALVDVMRDAGVNRFVGISGAGVDVPGDRKSRRDKVISWLINKLGGPLVADKPAELAVWRASALDWTLVRLPRLTDGPATGRVEHHASESTSQTSTRPFDYIHRWSRWRRRHQYRARTAHYQRRLQLHQVRLEH
ncbi:MULTISPECIES: NAD(P)-dependent oxidoreductase [unclassified Micromonospora]|uniref:NAD(P)-dependent oxidoreductase n=1 Tax=unclassified Micromonospora TaxID=2617518 RepID=UPI0003EEC218|nr:MULTISPECIES: NAD(P)H-binding protein [unclassified Micromonospora]EWM65010.1 NAD-dependent epimerase/dehydratase [Micromonospora sp. M42]MCK1809314.1 NAD(P)H-binding protein [Micromonospora sp. R42106]MCK1834198.1 NAD(P)H-binding protein [Micromonospora sp. R42003]MCK1846170.1 NAD(P)H-binding protein [Micromonospora sp. R42004]MCM1019864.1 NAD(P)H-binding protein [Micromonospora sp. XM-20-01]